MATELRDLTITEIAVLHDDEPANDGALVKLAKRVDPTTAFDEARIRFDKRLKKAKAKYYGELAAVERGEPVTKRRKKRRLVVTEETHETGERQPERLGPQSNRTPADYPMGKSASDVAASRETALQIQADAYCREVIAKGTTNPGRSGVDHARNLSAYEQHRKENLFDRSAEMAKQWTGDGPVTGVRKHNVAFSNSYEIMRKAAEERHFDDPSKTVEMHFSDIYQSREYADLRKADRDFHMNGNVDPAALALQKAGGRTIPAAEGDTDDGDEPCDDDLDGSMGDSDADGPELGPTRGPRGGAGTQSGGKSSGTYVQGHNTAHHSPSMAGGVRVEGSYNDRKRPRSATRRSMAG
jgi:hypothetical protein